MRGRSCAACPHMRPGSSFDGVHLFCEAAGRWTNLLDPRFAGMCIATELLDKTPTGQQLELALFGGENGHN